MSAIKLVTTLYNPGEKDKATLIDEFVVRQKEFNAIFDDIKTSKMLHPEQHYLLVGQRGSGKTTLMQRLRYAIDDDVKLNKWLVPIVFTEEQYNISELGNLWENIAAYLEDFYGMEGIVADMEKQLSKEDYEAKQLQVLITHLKKHKRKLALFIDNIGDLLDKFSEIEIKRLREVLMTISEIRLIAASPIVLEDVLDYRKPLLEFFKTIRLGGLNKEEIETLLRKLGDKYENKEQIENIIQHYPERIEILRRLTGGVVRTVVLMFNVFVENAEGNPLGDLKQIVDDVTPLYKHKMDDLPTQQQKIVDAVAKNWEAISTKEIAEKTRLESKVISAQLKQLEKNQYVEKIPTDTKNHLYQIKERFFNIWYLMRYGRTFDKNRVIWLVKFMESWLEKSEIEKRILNLVIKISKKEVREESIILWNEIYTSCISVSPLFKWLLTEYSTKQLSENYYSEIKHLKNIKTNSIQDLILNIDRFELNDRKLIERVIKRGEIEFANIIYMQIIKFISKNNISNFWIKLLDNILERDNDGTLYLTKASLLLNIDKDISGYVTFLEKSIKKENLFAINLKLIVSFELVDNKENCLLLVGKIRNKIEQKSSYDRVMFYLYSSWILLWNNKFEESTITINKLLTTSSDEKTINIINNEFVVTLKLLICKDQYHLAYKILTNEKYQLKDKMLPIYYALMHYMKNDYPNEYLRMPPEMKETVDEIMKQVEEYRVKYR